MQVTPAILPHSFEELEEKVERFSSLVSRVQIDISDGHVGQEVSWVPTADTHLPHRDTMSFECDIMMTDWRSSIENALASGMNRIVAHIDSFTEDELQELCGMLSPLDVSLGLAVSNDILVEEFEQKIRYVKNCYSTIFIQVMGIKNIGAQGQIFDESCIERISHHKQIFGDIYIQVDGGMRPETAKRVRTAGADGIVVGSYLLDHDDISGAIAELEGIEE